MKIKFIRRAAALALLALASLHPPIDGVHAQAMTAITYQGQLQTGSGPANGTYNLQFTLYNTNTGGVAIAGPVTNGFVKMTNGLFTVLVDFGPGAFTGATNWLQIAVQTNGASGFSPLNPRQQLTPVPSAIYAGTAVGLANGAAIGAAQGSVIDAGTADGFIGGGNANTIGANSPNAVVVGGNNNSIQYNNLNSVIAGGDGNVITHDAGWSAVAGGNNNQVSSGWGVVGGGGGNTISNNSPFGVIAGGQGNTIQANSQNAAIGGGSGNTAGGQDATVAGGSQNQATGNYSFALGQQAQATNPGTFVWSDSQPSPFASTNNDSFNVRAAGGAKFLTSGAGLTVDGQPVGAGCCCARTPISAAPFTITNSGSYYLATNLTVLTGDAIDIKANGVTLDLNGFTISSKASSANGTAIFLAATNGNTDVTILNGHIVSGVTLNQNGVFSSGPGFANGIEFNFNDQNSTGFPANIRVSGVSVSGCSNNGIDLVGGDLSFLDNLPQTVVESCTVYTVGGIGITASSASHCTAIDCGGDGIDANTASDCAGAALDGGNGIYASNGNNCYGSSTDGIGLLAGVAFDCTGSSSTGIGLACHIANSCILGLGTEDILYKYNMP